MTAHVETIRRALSAYPSDSACHAALDALLAVGERDRRQIARLRRIVHSFPPLPEMSSDAETAMYVRALKAIRRAVLAVEEDADNG